MKIIKQTIIRQTTQRRLVSRASSVNIDIVCPQRRVIRRMIPAVETAQLLGLSERRIFSLIEAGELHILETGDGRLSVCGDSIEEVSTEE